MAEPAKKAEPTAEEKMDAWGKRMDAMCSKMDAWLDAQAAKPKKDAKRADDDEGEAEPMASDDNRGDQGTDDPSTEIEDRLPPYARRKVADDAEKENATLEAQARADRVCRLWGKRAPEAMMGEPVRSYRRRLLKPLQQFSDEYSKVDLNLISDPRTFDIAERAIFADAARASSDNSRQPRGVLREIVREDQSGRRISEFVGDVSVTLEPFRMQPYRVRRINKNADSYLGG